MNPDLYFKQLQLGPMQNYAYVIGSQRTRECMIVDPAWEIQRLLDTIAADDMKLTGVLATHYHPDHVGGSMMGLVVEGLPTLMELHPVKIYAQKQESAGIQKVTGLSKTDLQDVESGETLALGDVEIRFIHTPGHTPGSQCFLVDNRLVSGDTLFIGGCGRVDLPGADPQQMYHSLNDKLAKLPDETVLYPGHNYSPQETSTIGEEKRTNQYLQIPDVQTWMRMMGGSFQ